MSEEIPQKSESNMTTPQTVEEKAKGLILAQVNLSGILDGRISGAFREWPRIRPELEALEKSIAELLTSHAEEVTKGLRTELAEAKKVMGVMKNILDTIKNRHIQGHLEDCPAIVEVATGETYDLRIIDEDCDCGLSSYHSLEGK